MERRIQAALGDKGFSGGLQQVLTVAQSALGVGGDDALQKALGEFFSAWSAVAAEPQSAAARQQALAAADGVARAFAAVRGHLQDTRKGLDGKIGATVDEIQQRLEKIAALNKEIRLSETDGVKANDLRDMRQQLANEVSERIGAVSFTDDEGNLNLMLPKGGVLVEGQTTAQLVTVADPANDGLLAIELRSPSGTTRRLDSSVGGELGGMLHARDVVIGKAVADIDQLAYDFATQVNALHSAGFGLDGVGGRDLFVQPASVARAAELLAVDPAVAQNPDALAAAQDAAALPGDNRVAQAIADLATATLAAGGTKTASEQAISIGAELGSSLRQAESDFELHSARLQQLSAFRESVSGVSIEEEMIELTKAQRAFEAATKVIQAGDEMLETLLSLK